MSDMRQMDSEFIEFLSTTCLNCFTVLSVSSGGRFADYVQLDVKRKFFNALGACESIKLTGFTESQAKKYVEERNRIRSL